MSGSIAAPVLRDDTSQMRRRFVIHEPEPSYPPAPWSLHGESVQSIRVVDIARARQLVPRELRIVPILPGRTLGALYCGYYGQGSTLSYHELIVAPALVYAGGRLGVWVSHIYVDDPTSLAAGRNVWGLPKELAVFDWAPDRGYVRVELGASGYCAIRWRAGSFRMRLPVLAPAVSLLRSRPHYFKGAGIATLERCRASIALDRHTPFRGLGFERALAVIHATRLRCRVTGPVPMGGA